MILPTLFLPPKGAKKTCPKKSEPPTRLPHPSQRLYETENWLAGRGYPVIPITIEILATPTSIIVPFAKPVATRRHKGI
jgi:hypothetical protein